ncbi:MAG: hypothetical protein R3B71_01570 [Candidatus Gracilibacteria bacterium]
MTTLSFGPSELSPEIKEQYPYPFTGQYLQDWGSKGSKDILFHAYIPGNGPARGEVTILKKDNGMLMIQYGHFENQYALLPTGTNEPIYVSEITMKTLGLDPEKGLNHNTEADRLERQDISKELAVVKAHRAYEEAVRKGEESSDEKYQIWQNLRKEMFPGEYLADEISSAVDTVIQETPAPRNSQVRLTEQAQKNSLPEPSPEKKSS